MIFKLSWQVGEAFSILPEEAHRKSTWCSSDHPNVGGADEDVLECVDSAW